MKVREYPQIKVRISPELKQMIANGAVLGNRTLNSEVCHQLEKAYGLKSPHEVALNEKASTVGAVEAHESTLNTQSKGDCNGNYSK
ncbi:hypothetical protein [Shewanella sp. Koi 1]